MREIPGPQLAVALAAAIALVAVGSRYLEHGSGPASAAAGSGAAGATTSSAPARTTSTPGGVSVRDAPAGPVVVDVAGAVRHPGVYTLDSGARVDDAVREAGGATAHADLSQVNLAARLEDGRQVLVPERAVAGRAGNGAVAGAAPASGAAGAPAGPVNLNTATLEQLETLDGVGPATAQKILDYRKLHGGFGSVQELGQVPGIGDKRLAALAPKVQV